MIGRENGLFSTNLAGAHAGANLYSLIEIEKTSGLKPWKYMIEVMAELLAADSVGQIGSLLP